MRIGYACQTVGVPLTDMKSCLQKNASPERLAELIDHNLNSLGNILDYNISNGIKLFRISSDLIPFGSSPVNSLAWWDLFADHLFALGRKIQDSGMRVSMHPGQYTVLNSPCTEIASRAEADLDYHTRVLDCLGLGFDHKIILHIGGHYQDKPAAISRFIAKYRNLDPAVKSRLVIENDDRSFHIGDILAIAETLNMPAVFDNLHHKINPVPQAESDCFWINACKKTWKNRDGVQKIHYSQQNLRKKTGSHSDTIDIMEFAEFFASLNHQDLDIMLEVKDKNLSAVKCQNCFLMSPKITALELEWSKYKYSILEKSAGDYSEIRKLLKNKHEYPALPFYKIIETAMQKPEEIGNSINAAQHVWGYFKDTATEKEKTQFHQLIQDYQGKRKTINSVKHFLWKMSVQYQQKYLLNSYYFIL